MSLVKPQTKITSIREHGLKALNNLADKHNISNVHLLTCIILNFSVLPIDEQRNILSDGDSLDLMIRMGCRLDESGQLDYSHIPQLNPPIIEEI